MPILHVEILEGRPPELKEQLIRNLTDTMVETLAVDVQTVRVILTEIPKTHWGIAGESVAKIGR
jgi:4-oxalocrotonate tautomerase